MTNISREDYPQDTPRDYPRDYPKDQPHRLKYPALQTPDQSAPPGKGHGPMPVLLFPTEESQLREKEASTAHQVAGLEKQLADFADFQKEELSRAVERSRLEGEQAGHSKAAAEFGQALAQSRSAVAAALEAFRQERQEYFRRVEGEVVKLALAIARKVLHREAQMDPMLLSAAVRVALDRLEESSSVVLRVPAAEGDGWRKALANLPKPPRLVEDAGLRPGDCVLESQMGTIELSIGAQLEEIERGFFDLLREVPRPQGVPAGGAAPGGGRRPDATL